MSIVTSQHRFIQKQVRANRSYLHLLIAIDWIWDMRDSQQDRRNESRREQWETRYRLRAQT